MAAFPLWKHIIELSPRSSETKDETGGEGDGGGSLILSHSYIIILYSLRRTWNYILLIRENEMLCHEEMNRKSRTKSRGGKSVVKTRVREYMRRELKTNKFRNKSINPSSDNKSVMIMK